jgi:hypothetical protein
MKADLTYTDEEKILIDMCCFEEQSDLKEIIDQYLVKICSPRPDDDITHVKGILKTVIFSKKDESKRMGFVAEFFLHLYLNLHGYTQQCLYINMEEPNSPKKWFDGFYIKDGDQRLVESKSGHINSIGVTHQSKIHTAYMDLQDKLTWKWKNDPRANARNHAKVVNASDDILNDIRKLTLQYNKGIYPPMSEFNIIPCGTIFMPNTEVVDQNDILKKIKTRIEDKDGKKIYVICISHKLDLFFLNYLNDNV